MLNETASLFVRPRLSLKRLLPFDPFDAEVLLRDETVEAFPETTP